MSNNRSNQRFFNSTHGRILALLRGSETTVKELAVSLNLTENAVRNQLVSLEREGLVEHSGMRRGIRKPHYIYTLTPLAEQLFPKAYDVLLYQVLHVLQKRLPASEVEAILLEVGHDLAGRATVKAPVSLEERIQTAMLLLSELGGAAEVEHQIGQFVLRGASCPFTAVVTEYPAICQAVATTIADITRADVQESCVRGAAPHCRFVVSEIA